MHEEKASASTRTTLVLPAASWKPREVFHVSRGKERKKNKEEEKKRCGGAADRITDHVEIVKRDRQILEHFALLVRVWNRIFFSREEARKEALDVSGLSICSFRENRRRFEDSFRDPFHVFNDLTVVRLHRGRS